MEIVEQWFKAVVAGLVRNPEAVVLVTKTDEQGVLFTLKVADEDAGSVIGKAGANAQALRTLLRSAGMKNNARISLKVEAPQRNY